MKEVEKLENGHIYFRLDKLPKIAHLYVRSFFIEKKEPKILEQKANPSASGSGVYSLISGQTVFVLAPRLDVDN